MLSVAVSLANLKVLRRVVTIHSGPAGVSVVRRMKE